VKLLVEQTVHHFELHRGEDFLEYVKEGQNVQLGKELMNQLVSGEMYSIKMERFERDMETYGRLTPGGRTFTTTLEYNPAQTMQLRLALPPDPREMRMAMLIPTASKELWSRLRNAMQAAIGWEW
jgi:hypothetical protein